MQAGTVACWTRDLSAAKVDYGGSDAADVAEFVAREAL
jgi:hypothetical protein